MNEIASKQRLPRTTQAAEGLPRWRWTTAELERLADLGAFADDDRFELIGGEIVPMSPKNRLHEVVREEVEHVLRKRSPVGTRVIAEAQFNLADDSYAIPDLLIYADAKKAYDLRGPEALLVVEVADTSIAYDQDVKAKTYARFGVREYWVINARTLETVVHLEPGEAGYAKMTLHPPDTTLVPSLAPALSIRLADLDID